MLKLKKAGVTLIEAMLAISLLGTATVGFLQLEKKKAEKERIENFEYEFTKILKGFDSKLMEDKLREKEYWTELSFTSLNFDDHLRQNLIHKDNRCAKESHKHIDMDKSYIPCHFVLPIKKVFKTNVSGNVEFSKEDKFKKYTLKFTPLTPEDVKELKPLSKLIKRSLNDILLYSDVNFMAREVATYKESSFMHCVKFKKDCFLQVTFGTRYDYLEEEKVIESPIDNKMVSITDGNMLDFEPSSDKKDKDFSEYENVKDVLDDHGIEATKEEVRQIEKSINELKNNKEFIKQLEEQLDYKCSKYDEDDYYFMSLYEKDNPCYIYKTKGLNGEL